MLFRENWTINVVNDDTPGFLTKAELDYVEYKLWRVYTEVETEMHDETTAKEVEISRKSLDSGDTFVLDGNGVIYCWIGKESNMEEKLSGQKLMQKIDADRNYTPIQYTIYEGDDDNWEEAFYKLLDNIEAMAPEKRVEISVEDQRELVYVAEEAKSVDEHKAEINAKYETTDPDQVPERMIQAGTDSHRKMVTGATVKLDELPREGTVAARLAAINSRAEPEKEAPKEPTREVKPPAVSMPPTTPVQHHDQKDQSHATGQSHQTIQKPVVEEKQPEPLQRSVHEDGREVSKTYGGAPEPSLTTLESGPESDEPKDLSKVKTDCVALTMHYTVWSVGKTCAVCGMGPNDCPNSARHENLIQQRGKCDICLATD